MTSLVDQSHTFYLHPFLRQRCMVWKQVKLVIESKWNPKWGRMTGYAVTAYCTYLLQLKSSHVWGQHTATSSWSAGQKWCNDVQRLSCKNRAKTWQGETSLHSIPCSSSSNFQGSEGALCRTAILRSGLRSGGTPQKGSAGAREESDSCGCLVGFQSTWRRH